MNNLTLRLLFGSLYVALILTAIFFGSFYFTILVAIFSFLSLQEMSALGGRGRITSVIVTNLLYPGIIIYLGIFNKENLIEMGTYLLWIIWAIHLVTAFFIRKDLQNGKFPTMLFTTLYIWLPLAFLAFSFVRNFEIKYLILFFATIWVFDSMCYVAGRLLGKKPLFPNVSPKKTVEGLLGGLVLTLCMMWVLNHFYLNMIWSQWVLITIVVSFFALWGDYVQSFMKRKLGVKDSGTLIPGHGGVLDRLDSVLFSALPFIIILRLLTLN